MTLAPNVIKKHIRAKHVTRQFNLIFSILREFQSHQSLAVNQRTKLADNKSDLSTFVASDLSLTHSHIFCNPHLKDLINSMTGGTIDMMGNSRLSGEYGSIPDPDQVDFVTNRPSSGEFAMIDTLTSREELTEIQQTTSTFIALKLSSELENSCPSANIKNHGFKLKAVNIYFLKSRFWNARKDMRAHDPEIQQMLRTLGLNSCQLIISPTSSFSCAVMKHFHTNTNFTFGRPSNRHEHAGVGKATLAVDKFIHILGARQLASTVRDQCIVCRKAAEKCYAAPPGKINKFMAKPPSQNHTGIMIDLLPNIRLNSIPNQV